MESTHKNFNEFTKEEIEYLITQREEANSIKQYYSSFELLNEFDIVPFDFKSSSISANLDIIQPSMTTPSHSEDWLISFTKNFRKGISALDKKIQGRILEGISELSKDPIQKIGNTQIPQSGELKGQWRRRLGNFRLIYFPEIERKVIHLLAIGSRGKIYQ